MSFWDRYLAPGDVRHSRKAVLKREQEQNAQQQQSSDPSSPAIAHPVRPPRLDPAIRARRQDALVAGGLALTSLSLYITRRSLIRRRLPSLKTFTPSNGPLPKVEGGLEAAEALGLATLNVFSIAMAVVGIGAKWLDIADNEDAKDVVRKGMGFDIYGGSPVATEEDKQMEDWIAEVMSRKEGLGPNIKDEIVQRLAEMEDKTMAKKSEVLSKEGGVGPNIKDEIAQRLAEMEEKTNAKKNGK